VEYASGEAERLNLPSTAEGTSVKLFIGGVPLAMSDEELRDYFSEFGQVTECHVLAPKIANPAVQTKAAFVRFARKADALTAIEKLDKKVPFPGVERPMDVRIAENRNESKPDDRMPYTTRPGAYQQPQRGYAQPSMGYQAQPQRALPGSMVPPAAPMRTPRTIGVWTEFHAPDGRPYYHNTVTNVTSWDPPVEFRLAGPPAPPPPMYHTGMPAPTQSSPEAKGPAGSNLFVFHVPADWSEAELYGQFAPFGNVIGYRIARERETGRPKGFGFVSFDNPGSAQAAMGSLNGIIVSNGKRLKVSLKKGEEGYAAGPMTYAAPY
jgi:CUG-BP- and ETR3-like factor